MHARSLSKMSKDNYSHALTYACNTKTRHTKFYMHERGDNPRKLPFFSFGRAYIKTNKLHYLTED